VYTCKAARASGGKTEAEGTGSSFGRDCTTAGGKKVKMKQWFKRMTAVLLVFAAVWTPGGISAQARTTDEATDTAYQTVDTSYFDDAVFIGDSRTVGLDNYTDLGKSKLYAKVSLSVFNVGDVKFIRISGKKYTLYQALKKTKFKKVYIMFGTNELGYKTSTFISRYKKMIKKIKSLQPDAIIYVEGILQVADSAVNKKDGTTHANIDSRNAKIKKMAEALDCIYLDVNSVITNTAGALIANAATDGVHLGPRYCKIWREYLLKHAVKKNSTKAASVETSQAQDFDGPFAFLRIAKIAAREGTENLFVTANSTVDI